MILCPRRPPHRPEAVEPARRLRRPPTGRRPWSPPNGSAVPHRPGAVERGWRNVRCAMFHGARTPWGSLRATPGLGSHPLGEASAT